MIHWLLLFKLIASNAISSVVSIVLQNHYFHDICIFSKKEYTIEQLISRVLACAFTPKNPNFALYTC